MLIFWIIVACMLVIACALVSIPLVRVRGAEVGGMQARKSPWLALIISVIFIFSALVMYQHYGDSQGLAKWYASRHSRQAVEKLMAQLKNPQQVIARLRQRLKHEPNSARGWYLLGRLYFTTAQFADAANAFAKSYRLQPENIDTTMQYAQSLYFAGHNHMTVKIQRLIAAVRKVDNGNESAINLLAINAYHTQDYAKAIQYWEQLLKNHPPQTTDGQVLLAAIGRAQRGLQLQEGNNKQHVNHISIPVVVSLLPTLRQKISQDATVFIFAQAINGPKVPLAVVRKKVADLPVTIRLTEAMAMLPNMSLTDFKKVRIIARITQDGHAQLKQGQWFGDTGSIDLSKHFGLQHIVINKQYHHNET